MPPGVFAATFIVPSGLIVIDPVGSATVVVNVTSLMFIVVPFKVSFVKTLPTVVAVGPPIIGAGLSSVATIANVGLAVQKGSAGG
ncbi:hypothetical protein D3C71_1995960 [compost metagenome]